jgi:hypothetical protein
MSLDLSEDKREVTANGCHNNGMAESNKATCTTHFANNSRI